jgi:hypothetical protein
VYDPSYGRGPYPSENAWENDILDGVGVKTTMKVKGVEMPVSTFKRNAANQEMKFTDQ